MHIMTRRSRLEICLEILWIIKNGTSKPTRIMYGANLSWKPCSQILSFLLSQGLIREIDTQGLRKRDRRTSKLYEITQKGENIIRYFHRAKEMLLPREVAKAL